MVNLLFTEDDAVLTKRGIVKTLFDPACGTGGMLSVAEEYLRELNPDAQLEVFGQELNDESFAICKSDMMVKAQNPANIARGNSFSEDGHHGQRFDYTRYSSRHPCFSGALLKDSPSRPNCHGHGCGKLTAVLGPPGLQKHGTSHVLSSCF